MVYPQLTDDNKQEIAAAIVDAQARTAHLPEASGFGFATSYADPALKRSQNWQQVIIDNLEGSRRQILSIGVVNAGVVDHVLRCIPKLGSYFSEIRPIAFLDDTTTKNVLVYEGSLSGIVDVDEICFGDPLQTVGLTQMALLALRFDTDYIQHWLDHINATAEKRAVVDFYTARNCVGFLSEQGQAFNRDQCTVDEQMIAFLEKTLGKLLSQL